MRNAKIEWNIMDDEAWDYFVKNVALINIVDLTHQLTEDSKTKCRQLVKSGAVTLNNIKLDDIDTWVDIKSGRFYKGLNNWMKYKEKKC
jgi:hypothetical protein